MEFNGYDDSDSSDYNRHDEADGWAKTVTVDLKP